MKNLKRVLRGTPEHQTTDQVDRLRKRITRLERRTAELAEDLQQQRQLSLRVAELTDLVTELVGAAARGETEFRRVLDKYEASI